MTTIVLEAVEKWFGETQIIKGIDLEIDDGEFVVFVGPSGCGKSTLLRLVSGLEEASRGKIHVGGRDVTALPPSERGLAMVFQSYALYPQMTVKGNLSFGLKNAGVPKGEIEERVARAAEILQIEPLLRRKPSAQKRSPRTAPDTRSSSMRPDIPPVRRGIRRRSRSPSLRGLKDRPNPARES